MAKKTAVKKATKPKAPKAPKKVAAPKDIKNGRTRPKEGSDSRKVWDTADKLAAKNGHNNNRGELLTTLKGMNVNTVTTQFGYWRTYNGVKGRVAKPKVAKVPKKAAKKKPAPPKAPKKKAPPAPPAAPAVSTETPATGK